ncbi:MAG: ribosome maturation factor RimP [Actinomycetota bacterium]|nr:ribosome maturation factor RimP [Actinomycetota bacterium]
MGKRSDRARADRVSEAIADLVVAAGFDLEDVHLRPAGRRTQVIITVDGDYVDSDGLARLSREVSERLDVEDILAEQPYTLEVSSRGVGTPLTQPRHWRRNVGRLVAVHMVDGTNLTGRIGEVDDKGAVLDDRRLRFKDVERAVVQVEFGEAD